MTTRSFILFILLQTIDKCKNTTKNYNIKYTHTILYINKIKYSTKIYTGFKHLKNVGFEHLNLAFK